MSGSEEPYTLDQLPQNVRLGSALTIGNPRQVNGGWIVGIYALDG